jgi:hypothetical protein
MTDRITRTIDELWDKHDQQIGFLRRSASMYDSGSRDEAVRLATTLRLLLHDGGRSTSLLSLLKIKDQLRYVDTARHRSDIDATRQALLDETRRKPGRESAVLVDHRPGAGLVDACLFPDGSMAWTPRLATTSPNPHVAFDEWWSTLVIEGSDERIYSRAQIVTVMANQDGGAHVDQKLDAAYRALVDDDLGFQTVRPEFQDQDWTLKDPPGGWISPLGNVTHATVRQITHELLVTLEEARALEPGREHRFKTPS